MLACARARRATKAALAINVMALGLESHGTDAQRRRGDRIKQTTSAMGLVSRAPPVHTAMRNCTRDEGGPFEFGNQVLISNHRKLLWSKATVVNVAEIRNKISIGVIERGERKRTAVEVSKAD